LVGVGFKSQEISSLDLY
jgi:hypothetical protein